MLRPRSLAIILGILVLAAGCGGLGRLEVGEYVIRTVETGLVDPDWLDDETLIAVDGWSANLVELSMSGSPGRTYTVDDPTIARLTALSVSPDKTRVAFRVVYKGPEYDFDSGNLNTLPSTDV